VQTRSWPASARSITSASCSKVLSRSLAEVWIAPSVASSSIAPLASVAAAQVGLVVEQVAVALMFVSRSSRPHSASGA
jgi:hypothetical protein